MGSEGGGQIGWSVLHGRISGIYLVISVSYRYMILEYLYISTVMNLLQ